MIFPDLKTLKLFGVFFLLGIGADAMAADLQTLVDRPPFSPAPGSAAAKTEAAPETLEFRGLVVDERGTTYSLFDVAAKRSYWVREDGKGSIRFKAFDAEECVLEVEQNGQALTLPLKSATIATAAVSPPTPPVRAGRPVRILSRPAPVSAEGARIMKIAEQVRQRRAERQAAARRRQTAGAAASNPGF